MEQNTLAEMILTKFCHDIAGVTGALQNGAELLLDSLDDKDFLKDAASALNNSAKVLSARLRFFRMAFGSGKEGFESRAAEGLIKEYLETLNGITFTIEPFEAEDFARARLKMILALVAAECFTRGGKISFFADKVLAAAEGAALKEPMRSAIMGEETSLTPEQSESAVGLFLYLLAKSSGYKITITQKPDSVIFSLK